MPSFYQPSYHQYATLGLLCSCIIFGLGSVIVAHVAVGAFAMAFWRLCISSLAFWCLAIIFRQNFPKSINAWLVALGSGAALGLDLALWHESVHAVGPGISTLLNGLQIFFLTAIGFVFFHERQSHQQLISLCLATLGVVMIASPEFTQNQYAPWGFIAGIASGGFLAISMTLVRQTHKIEPVAILPMMTLVGIGGAGTLLPLTLWLETGLKTAP